MGTRRTRRSGPSSSRSSTSTRRPRRGRGATSPCADPPGEDGDIIPQWARDWQATLFDHGWMIPGYPPELGGRNATPVQTLVYLEEMASRSDPAVGALPRLRDRRAEPARVRQRRAAGARAGRDPRRHRLVHRDERAERRLRPRRAPDPRRCSTATTSSSTARRSGRRTRLIAQMCFCYVRTDPDVAEAQGHLAAHRRHGHARHRDPAAAPPQRRRPTSPRCSSPTSSVPAREPRRRAQRRVALTQGSLAHERAGLWVEGVRPARADASPGSSTSPGAVGRRRRPDRAAPDRARCTQRAVEPARARLQGLHVVRAGLVRARALVPEAGDLGAGQGAASSSAWRSRARTAPVTDAERGCGRPAAGCSASS